MFNEVRSALKMLAGHDLDKLIASASIESSRPPDQQLTRSPTVHCQRPPDSSEIIDPNHYTYNTDVAASQHRQKSSRSAEFPESSVIDAAASNLCREFYSRQPKRLIQTAWKMISDQRIEAIESLIASGLNEENVQNPPRVSEISWPYFVPLKRCLQTGIGAVTVRVFAVKASSQKPSWIMHFETQVLRQISIGCSTSHGRHSKKTLLTFMSLGESCQKRMGCR